MSCTGLRGERGVHGLKMPVSDDGLALGGGDVERGPGSGEGMTDWEPKITTFLCNWCSYGAADLAGVSRLQYPSHFRVIRVPCSARVSPKFILAAFRHGADGVWVSG